LHGATTDLEKAKTTEGESAELIKMLGIGYYSLSKKDQAVTWLEKSFTSGEKESKVALYTGYLRFDNNNFKGASDALIAAETAGEKEDDLYSEARKSILSTKNLCFGHYRS
jgi:hypothetical protein